MSGKIWAPLIVPPCLSGPVLDRLLPMQVGLDLDYLREWPLTFSLYDYGIRYERDKEGQVQWLSVPAMIAKGTADCKSLACWRVAELVIAGETEAIPIWIEQKTASGLLFHIQVRRANGDVEDPSEKLGMMGVH